MTLLPRATIVHRQELTDELWVIKLHSEISFTFKPGQYITIGVNGIERPYSIVSAPHEKLIELFIELVPQGDLTPLLYEMGVGSSVSIRPRAKGLFTLDPSYDHHLMVGTVTGSVPYISILRDYFEHETQAGIFHVLEGASYSDEFAYYNEFSALADNNPSIVHYLPSVSRPEEARNSGWRASSGRINDLVEQYINNVGLSKEKTLVYLCGHPGMITDVKSQLFPLGWNIKEERFWKE